MTRHDDGDSRSDGAGPIGHAAARAGGLLAVPGAVAWASSLPFVFPSLGPTAYLMAVRPNGDSTAPRRVVGGHAIGVLAGLLAYHALAPGLVVTAAPAALSIGGLRLAASAVLSVGLTTAGMRATDTGHAPACATTLIVSLGLLSSLEAGAVILAGVLALVVADSAVADGHG